MATHAATDSISHTEFEARRRAEALHLLGDMREIVAWDKKMNENILRITKALADYLEANPDAFANAVGGRFATAPAHGSGVSGEAQSFAGGNAFDEIVHTIIEVLTGEKDFVKEIILKILDL